MKKLSLVVISTLFTVFFLVGAIPSYAKKSDFSSAVVNGDGILAEDEADKIYTALCDAESKTDVTFLIAVYSSEKDIPSGMETVEGCGLDPYSDDVVLLIVEVGQVNYYELFTYGVADTVITQSAAEKILDDDDIFTSIKSGDLYGGITAFIGSATSAIRAYRRNLVLIILAVALAAAGASVGAVVISYKKKLKSPIYPLTDYADLTLTERSDVFLGKTVTKVRISSPSDGGHSGKSGGGGGGSRGRR